MANHFWVGSLCLIAPPSFPPNVTAVSDMLTILGDMGNRIPDKSWMLYLLELFEKNTAVPIELDLICQFDSKDNFWAIFGGINRYRFTKVLPAIGHSYLREIIMRNEEKSVEYSLTDLDTNQNETFALDVSSDSKFSYKGGNHFTGLEWWNKASGGNHPFPVRYKVQVAGLGFSQATYRVPLKRRVYRPYNVLIPNKDGANVMEYPVSFENLAAKDGSIGYFVASGNTTSGMRYLIN